MELTVYFCSPQGSREYDDVGFGKRLKWDTPLLEGYRHVFLDNLRSRSEVNGFLSLINPAIVRELRVNRYDAVLIHGHSHATDLLAMASAKIFQVPILMRCETHLDLKRSKLKRSARRVLMNVLYGKVCAGCLPIGSLNRAFYQAHGVSDEKLFTVPYAVDNSFFIQAADRFKEKGNALKSELGLPLDRKLILFASKLMERKRPQDVLEAFDSIKSTCPPAALMFVGSGEQEGLLTKMVRDRNISDVHFFGFQNQSELSKFYAVADVFVFPSENEPWGLILNEAMCAGLPLIVSEEIGAAADLVRNGENGFTFPARNVDQLSQHLRTLLTDDLLRAQMGAKSRTMIEDWDYERCVSGILSAVDYVSKPKARRSDENSGTASRSKHK